MLQIFRGATVHTCGPEGVLERAEVVVEDGRVVAVGSAGRSAPRGATVHDLRGRHLTPGLIDPHVHMGVMPEGFANESKDINEMTAAVTPQMQAIDAVWPGDVAFARARAAGVTTVCVLPGSANVVSGLGVVLKTAGRNVERMALRPRACLKVAFGFNVKNSHGVNAKRMPLTRMGIAALFREAFDGARLYAEKREKDPATPVDRAKEALLLALRGEVPVRAHAARSDDILTALRLAREYGLRLILEHAYEAGFVLDEVREGAAGVVLGPMFRCCGTSEATHLDFALTARLDEAGVTVAHMTDHPIVPVGYLAIQAGLCVRAGLSPERALLTITRHAARILEHDDRIGALAVGRDADLVVFDGPPLEVASRVLSTWIEGRQVYAHGDPLPIPGGGWSG
jgi:imidazolonepropionase-like amidohydrolase